MYVNYFHNLLRVCLMKVSLLFMNFPTAYRTVQKSFHCAEKDFNYAQKFSNSKYHFPEAAKI